MKMEDINKEDKIRLAKKVIISFHITHINKAIDECTNKTLDFESAMLIKQIIEVSMEQICEALLKIKKEKETT